MVVGVFVLHSAGGVIGGESEDLGALSLQRAGEAANIRFRRTSRTNRARPDEPLAVPRFARCPGRS